MKHMMKITQVALLGLAVLAAPGAIAQQKQAPPEGSQPKSFALPEINRMTLSNGVEVTLVPYGKVPKVSIRAVVLAGNADDGDQPWISDLTSSMMEQGAGGASGADVSRRAAAMGGNVNFGVGWNQTTIAMDVLSENADDAIDLLADVVMKPNFPEDQFARKQADMVRRVAVTRAGAQSQAGEAFNAILYPDHPYGTTLPADGQLESYTLEDVKAFHEQAFKGNRTRIYIVGQFNEGSVLEAIKTFERMPAGEAPERPVSAPNTEPGLALVDRPGAPQSTIRLGRRVPPPDGTVELAAANTMLGGYFSSRITRNIREDKGYTYSPGSQVSNRLNAANWQQNADVTTEDTGAALSEIMYEIKNLQDEAPGEAEVQGVRNYMNGVFVIRLASRGGMAGQLAFADLHGLGADYLSGYVEKVSALTAEDFQEAAQEYMRADDLSLVVVGPVETVRAQLATLPDFADRLPAE